MLTHVLANAGIFDPCNFLVDGACWRVAFSYLWCSVANTQDDCGAGTPKLRAFGMKLAASKWH